ncbi:phage baseplate plug family protein [Burkholderia cepacia]|uniref:phage baseplate plug family protein n=1 Tax=Burkholderia cepacia TaxID=292 RepID=UPI002FE2B6FE
MTTFYEIPLTPDPQTFTLTLSGVIYRLTVQYRAAGGTGWILDIADASGNALVNGIPLVTGVDLLGQYTYLGFGGRLWVQGAASPDDVPTFDDLGVGSHVFWVTD